MDEIRCSIKIEGRAEGKPARLTGTLMVYNERARDRPEVFEVGSLKWDASGIVLNRQHNRAAPILRLHPVAALVDSGSYEGATVEARERALRDLEWERWQRETVL